MIRILTTAFLASMTITSAAQAATVIGFDGVRDFFFYGDDFPPETYVEDGVTIGGSPAGNDADGIVHMDDAGTLWSNFISASTGGLFSALAVTIYGLPQYSYIDDGTDIINIPHRNVWFRGFVDGAQVAELGYSSGLSGFDAQVRLGADFSSLDYFTVTAETEYVEGMVCADAPCGHFDLDNLIVGAAGEVLPPVPLPAAGWLLLGAIGALGVMRRR